MSRFECPDCGGGFPEPAECDADPESGLRVEHRCPWCGHGFSTLQGVTVSEPDSDVGGQEADR